MNRIGIDLGGTKTEIILTTENPLEVLERKRVATQRDKGYDFILNQLATLINDFQNQCETAPMVGIGIPGIIDPQTGQVKSANTTCLIGHPLKSDLESLIDHQVTISNDANCFALSEALYGAGQGYQTVLGVILGTGTGGGLIAHGKVWEGKQGIGAEIGHVSLNRNGAKCWCGIAGCMEQYISGTGLQRLYFEKTQIPKTAQEIYADYIAKDRPAKEVFDDYLEYFGQAIGGVICVLDPEIIVLGGGLSNVPELYTFGLESIRKFVFSDNPKIQLVQNQLGDSSGVYGAALLSHPEVKQNLNL